MMLDLDRITHPLRLASGSHQPGSGRGCAMNVISYINGDTEITDFPACSARILACMVQWVNDSIAVQSSGLLTARDSIQVLDLGWLTVGTAGASDELVNRWLTDLLVDPAWGIVRYLAPEYASIAHRVAQAIYRSSSVGFSTMHALAEAIGKREVRDAEFSVLRTIDHIVAHFSDTGRRRDEYAALDAVRAAAKAGERIDFTRSAIQHWRDLMGLDQADELVPADVDSALDRIGVTR